MWFKKKKKSAVIIDINETPDQKHQFGETEVSRDYEGGTILVDYENGLRDRKGEPNKCMIAAVKGLVANKEDVVVVIPKVDEAGMAKIQYYLVRWFGVKLPTCVQLADQKVVEYWSTKAVQFLDNGMRVDGANVNGTSLIVHIHKKPGQAVELSVEPPVITRADEQVASLGIYLYRAIKTAMQTLSEDNGKTLRIDPNQLRPASGTEGEK